MAKKPWIILGFLLVGAIGAETGRRVFFSSESSTVDAEKELSDQVKVSPVTTNPAQEIPQELLTKETDIRRLFAEKNYGEVLALIDNELRNIPPSNLSENYRSWLNRQRWIVKTAQAWLFLEKQNCSAALTILEEIPELDRPEIALKGMGYCKFLAREWQDADSFLTHFVKTHSQDHEAVQMLAKVKEAQGEYDEALQLTESLQDLDESQTAELEIEPLRKSLLAKQDESLNQITRAGPFYTLHYQPSLNPDFVDKVADTVQKVAAKLNSDYGIEPPERPVDIFFHTAERFGEITHGPEWSAGIYDGQIRLPVPPDGTFSEEVSRVIRHEVTHALLSELVGRRNLPTWFQEGFAQLLECETLCTQFDYAATTQKFMPIEKFEQPFISLPTREAQVAYKQSHYMILLLIHYRPAADIRQMFTLMPGLESLTSEEIIAQTAWSFPLLHKSATNTWEKQISLKSIKAPH